MFVRKLAPAALGLWLSFSQGTSRGQEGPPLLPIAAPEPGKLALEPSPLEASSQPSVNQRMADAIAERLQLSGRLRGYQLDIRFAEGIAELSGRVSDATQRDEVLQVVRALPGVEQIRDLLETGEKTVVLAAQTPKIEQGPLPQKLDANVPPIAAENKAPFAVNPGLLNLPPSMPQEPVSIMPMMPPGFNPGIPSPAVQPPPMPPNAWPTYAPYNNYSRVAYPTLYPYEAFPFIGPMYPFPKIPLGWRSISLTWQDGHWWYGRQACGHDWWRIRYR